MIIFINENKNHPLFILSKNLYFSIEDKIKVLRGEIKGYMVFVSGFNEFKVIFIL